MPGRQRNDDDVATARAHFVRADHGVGCVVASFDDHVGLKELDEFQRRVLLEQRNCIHRLEGGQHVRALALGAYGAIGAFQAFHGGIAVQADDEHIAPRPRADEYIDVSGMKQIEYAVGEDDTS